MDVEAIRKELKLKPSAFARQLGVSPGHGTDLRTGRRKLTIKLAAKLEEMTGRPIVAEVVKAKMEAA